MGKTPVNETGETDGAYEKRNGEYQMGNFEERLERWEANVFNSERYPDKPKKEKEWDEYDIED